MMQTAYGDDCISRSQVFEWYSRFKNGRESLEDDPRERRPSAIIKAENIEMVSSLLAHNHLLSMYQNIIRGDRY